MIILDIFSGLLLLLSMYFYFYICYYSFVDFQILLIENILIFEGLVKKSVLRFMDLKLQLYKMV